MKCPNCLTSFHFEEAYASAYAYDQKQENGATGWDICHIFCPECDQLIVALRDGYYKGEEFREFLENIISVNIVYPNFVARPVAAEVPEAIKKNYLESAAVLSLSPKASAAISRRILQNILREAVGVKPSSLSAEIDQFMRKSGAPSYLLEAVDAIRNIGNFAAHPLKDTNTGEIVDVEPGEAEWLLDVLEAVLKMLLRAMARSC